MTDLFVDTFFWGHLVDPTQAYHMLAATLYRYRATAWTQGHYYQLHYCRISRADEQSTPHSPS